ncbi:hypothetical protein D3C77_70450 [compost metagenome]
MHRGFGDAVHIDQARSLVAEALEPGGQAADIQRFTTEHHVTQTVVALLVLRSAGHVHELAEGRGGLVEDTDVLVTKQTIKIVGRARDVLWHDQQTAALEQGTEDLPHRKVERVGVKQAPDVVVVEAEPVLGGVEQAQHIAVRQQRAFGPAGRAGGVDDVGQVIRMHGDVGVAVGQACRGAVEGKRRQPRRYRQTLKYGRLTEEQDDAAVFDHVGQTVVGVLRIKRHIGTAGLENSEDADEHVE